MHDGAPVRNARVNASCVCVCVSTLNEKERKCSTGVSILHKISFETI